MNDREKQVDEEMEKEGRFQIILEARQGEVKLDKVIYDSINECDGMISHHHNLSWLVRKETL